MFLGNELRTLRLTHQYEVNGFFAIFQLKLLAPPELSPFQHPGWCPGHPPGHPF